MSITTILRRRPRTGEHLIADSRDELIDQAFGAAERRRKGGRHSGPHRHLQVPERSVIDDLAELDEREARPQPPQGAHPYAAPLPQTVHERISGRRPKGARHTQAWTPEFAHEGRRPRPYAPRNNPVRPYPWLPDTWRPRPSAFVRERMDAITYPAPDAQPSEVAEFFRRIDRITGTTSSFGHPWRCAAWARGITAGAA